MTNNLKPTPVTVQELAKRLETLADTIDKKVSDALYEQSGLRQVRIMCRAGIDTHEDMECLDEVAHVHGFLDDEEIMDGSKIVEKEEDAA